MTIRTATISFFINSNANSYNKKKKTVDKNFYAIQNKKINNFTFFPFYSDFFDDFFLY